MFQPEPAAYIQVSTGYAIPHSVSDYTFEETPLRLNDGRGSGALGTGPSGANALLYAPMLSAPAGNRVQVGPAPSSPGSFNFNPTSLPAAPSTVPAPSHQPAPLPILLKMESSADELVAQEAAAREYQPQLEGPLVGKKTPSTAITEEYAKADPIYVQKTMMLPQTYTHYRQIQGDGNCGWRAIGFGYFETLIKTGSKARVDAEKERMQALNAYIETAGGVPAYVFQDFADETSSLLEKMSEMIGNPERAAEELLEAFNTPDVSNSIMYHFRLMASAYLKGHRDTYGDFISTGTGVDGYCQAVLERHGVEIDHLGLELLVNVLLKPIDFVLEVAYLDRSPGSEVNIYRFPKEANSQLASDLGPTIHLLYRPDHYDILYPPEPVSLQVHRVTSLSQSYEIASTPAALHSYAQLNLQPLAFIPGFDASPAGLAPILDTTSASPLTTYSPSPVSPWVSAPFPDPALQATSASMAIPPPAPPLQPQTHPLRFSEYCQLPEYVENNTRREPTFQTATFKNSHFNVAHYNNPNFQPEEYKPEADDHDSPPRGGGRKRGSV